MMYNMDPVRSELQEADTLVLIAWVFSILAMIGFAIGGVISILFAAMVAAGGLLMVLYYSIPGVIMIVFAALDTYFFIRIGDLRKAIRAGDAVRADSINTVALGVLTLVFDGIITGILLLIARNHTERAAEIARSGGNMPQQPANAIYDGIGGGYVAPPQMQYPQPQQYSSYPGAVVPGQYQQPATTQPAQQLQGNTQPHMQQPVPSPQPQYNQPVQGTVVVCPSCHRNVSAYAVNCPYCGYKLH